MPTEVTAPEARLRASAAQQVLPGSFEPGRHFYPRVLNAQIHPLVAYFLRMGNRRLVERYCHLNPRVDPDFLLELLTRPTTHFRWSGTDLLCTTTASGARRLVVLETNSCPSGNKSMPALSEENEQAGYRRVLEAAFMPALSRRGGVEGGLAVLYDKNLTEASGYAAAMADLTGERVWLAPCSDGQPPSERAARFSSGLLRVRADSGEELPIRAAFRYVTQRPWNRLPVRTRTRIVNPVVACLAGGRNKLVAAKAYDLLNAELFDQGLEIRTPETLAGVSRAEIPLCVDRFGGHAVIKVPYSNAGQGVFPILGKHDLDAFMSQEYPYDCFVVQSLIGNYSWSSRERAGRFYHVGTMPNRRGSIYAADLRMMCCSGPSGFFPVAVYARRAAKPLPRDLSTADSSWAILGTNLSVREGDGSWSAETERLLIMDAKDFNTIGIGSDDLIEAYIQSVLCTKAIDQMCSKLLTKRGDLRTRLFRSLDQDEALVQEVKSGCEGGAVGAVPGSSTAEEGAS